MAQPAVDDPEAAELRALADMHRTVRFSEIACELEERQRDAMRRQLEAWEKYEAAVRAKITLEGRLTVYFLLVVSVFGWVATMMIELARLLL